MEADRDRPAFLFDLDGTLVDSVYQHVLSWREALECCGIELAVWRIHRRVGMSGGLFASALLRETGKPVTAEQAEELQQRHAEAYARQAEQVQPLPGAKELLAFLTKAASLGYRSQWEARFCAAHSATPGAWIRCSSHHSGPGAACQARSGFIPDRR